jgi:peptide/nickel transport system ATP-binding protein
MSAHKLLDIKDLRVSFQQADGSAHQAVDGLNLALERGDAVGLVGESGSGKTLTALAVMRLLPRQLGTHCSGQIFFQPPSWRESKDLMQLPERALQEVRGHRISMVFQEPMRSLNPVFRCGDQVAEALSIHQTVGRGKEKEEVLYWLEQMQLRDPERIYQSYPHQLSGGQKQRVMLAVALCTRPDLLLADEPTTALDVTVQREFLDLLLQLKEELGLSILFISHDLGMVHHLCDRIVVMRDGKVVEEGATQQIFSFPKQSYTLGLLECRPPMDRTLDRLPVLDEQLDDMPVLDAPPGLERPRESAASEGDLLAVSNIRVAFRSRKNWWSPVRKVQAVDGVSFRLGAGEPLGIVGESGSGKTTLARCILGLQDYQEGSIHFRTVDMRTATREQWLAFRQQVQIVFQDPFSSLQPRMPVGEALREPLRVHFQMTARQERDRVVELLEQVGLSAAYYERYPYEFSGGQRQRLAIARALMLEPRLLICDESVSSLDVSIQAQILNLLKELQERFGLSLLFITHDLSVVRFLCQRVLVMYEGRVVEEGSVEELFSHPRSAYTRKLLEAVPA